MDEAQERSLALRYAPVICHEVTKRNDKQVFDCFSRIDFNGRKPWRIHDRRPELEDTFAALELLPAIYYSLVSTATHHFILYSVYHAFDMKTIGQHEHDFEHAQVVINRGNERLELLTTNAHYTYYHYVPFDGERPLATTYDAFRADDKDERRLYLHGERPIIYVQPSDGSIVSNITSKVGHGIVGLDDAPYDHAEAGDRPTKGWDPETESFAFKHKNEAGRTIGLIGMPHDDAQQSPYDPAEIGSAITAVRYTLVRTQDTIWGDWFLRQADDGAMGGLFQKTAQWRPTKLRLRDADQSRHKYFLGRLGERIDDILYPEGFVGTIDSSEHSLQSAVDQDKARRKAAGKWPFAWEYTVNGARYWHAHNRTDPGISAIDVDAFWDPAVAYRVLVDPPEGTTIDYDYQHHEFLDASGD